MELYSNEVIETFLQKQGQLFRENVADSYEEAEEFLEECMAVVCRNIREVREYFEEAGTDISNMTDDDLKDACEVFELPSGGFLIVEG